nr:sugar phosphate nucleotidyltransferase [Terribacillus saccharophilus]
MRIILLSGGSGKRLWPLSNDARSKQFLKVLSNQEHKLESMLQRVYGQLKKLNLDNKTSIATSKDQVEIIKDQIGIDVNVIAEPSRRDTFPAIALAATYLFSEENVSPSETIVVLPVDPYVADDFFMKVKELDALLNDSTADLALIGIKPTFPSEKYGYIVPCSSLESGFSKVDYFKEKPSEIVAKELLNNGALWNSGVFGFKLGYLMSIIEEMGYLKDYNSLLEHYNELAKISFDYAVVEKTKKIVVASYNGFWKDLGTWNTLTEEMATKKIGGGYVSDNSTNTHLVNELEVPVTVLGIKDAIIAASPDGILVSSKKDSPKIKELMGSYNAKPMYEEKSWGTYRVLNDTETEDMQITTRILKINKDCVIQNHYHEHRKEILSVIKGSGYVVLNDVKRELKPGVLIEINAFDSHELVSCSEPLEVLEILQGEVLDKNDMHISRRGSYTS